METKSKTGLQTIKTTGSPQQIVEAGRKAAAVLSSLVKQAGWVVKINGKDYLQFEAWQTLARFYGLTVKTVETKFVEYGSAKGFEAKAVVLDGAGKEIGGAEALCLNDETNWRGRPLFALKSMAQTRASAKALRQLLSWVVVLAGFKPTPAEEIDGIEEKKEAPRKCQYCGTVGRYHKPGCPNGQNGGETTKRAAKVINSSPVDDEEKMFRMAEEIFGKKGLKGLNRKEAK